MTKPTPPSIEDKPPFFRTWSQLYWAVVIQLLAVVLGLYWFAKLYR